ncbi:bifunctional 2',3'-cyclic-nucleotide 2'-phosphodiesterase/3'-nucleotidase [Rhodophyticola sp. CCM32]|uniref:bifunctional 2',3'-cyclic-nucleotide 2'-phosphodiesterase/3'-nucleotidase n=1 Tax=Rhodophyticola sp. CCM32 TaxID=2916397 RepID=UPI00107FC30D|nr:bifunctional 2',3'-cyclic-nucleotide 2'-phosphodiesterase/3'-nucleotidase [Rhodophyticola sp. CCM32]QBY02275.1 bifunctional 2',3'-cyclic-nucleotide 2'-phosphodiesterase/3'-nucleotidase [Rhodophyticola sp. CCM32]
MPAVASSEHTVLGSLHLRVLATSDLHANLYPYNYYTDRPHDGGGLARAGGLIAQLRDQADNCLLVDNGDTLQGTPLGDFAAHTPAEKGRLHPMIAAMDTLGYDAMTLGNHDFNYGLEFLQSTLAGAAFPAVLANIRWAGGAPLVPPWVILDRTMRDSAGRPRQMRIGLIGLAPPQTLQWDRYILDGRLEAEDMLTAARRDIPAMRKAGADLVVVLSHSGLGAAQAYEGMENAGVPLAALTGVDALVAGHTHRLFPAPQKTCPAWMDIATGTVHGTPVVQPGYGGSHLGVIDLTLSEITQGKWRVSASQSSVHPVGPELPEDAAAARIATAGYSSVIKATAQDHKATLNHIRCRIGETRVPLESYFALITNSAAVQVVADAQRAFAREALDGHALQHLPLLAAAAPFKSGGPAGPQNYTDIPKGPLAIKNAADLYIFPNSLAILRANGAQVTDWLERAACAFHQIHPGRNDQALIDHRFAAYNFDVLDGLTYAIDVTAPARYSADGERCFDTPGRIHDLCHAGQPVTPDQEFLIVTNSHRAAGGGRFTAAGAATPVLTPKMPVRDVLIRYFTYCKTLNPQPGATWRFHPAGGIRAVAEIGPGALAYPERITACGLDYLGQSDSGFIRFALTV